MIRSKQHERSDRGRRRRPSRSSLAAFACAIATGNLVACSLVVGDAFDVKAANDAGSLQEGEAGGSLPEASPTDERPDEPVDAAPDVHPSGPITYVQGNSTDSFKTPSRSLTASFSSDVSAGNTIIVALQTSATIVGVSGGGKPFERVVIDGPDSAKLAIYYALNLYDGPLTIRVDFASASGAVLAIHEYSGITTRDLYAQNSGTGTAVDTNAVELTEGNQLLFAFARCNTGLVNEASKDFTKRQYVQGNLSEDRIVSGAGRYTATFTALGEGGDWTALIASFKGVPQ